MFDTICPPHCDATISGETLKDFTKLLTTETILDAAFFTHDKKVFQEFKELAESTDDFQSDAPAKAYWDCLSDRTKMLVSKTTMEILRSDLKARIKPIEMLLETYEKVLSNEKATSPRQATAI